MSVHDHAQYVDNHRHATQDITGITRWLTATLLTLVIAVVALLSPTPAIASEGLTSAEASVVVSVQK